MKTDIPAISFWDKFPKLKPFAQLARWDRPIGIWLLFWPCVWGLALAPGFQSLPEAQSLSLLVLFFIGAVAMRGAGCTLNDLTDRKLDAQVARTKDRPLANGSVSVNAAIVFIVLQSLVGAAVLFQLSTPAIIIGLLMVPLIALYPWMKRITWWPQILLGIIFNSGALIGWAAIENSISHPALFLYLAGVFWTLAYDTIYAHLDMADDALIGIKSTALRLGPDSKIFIGLCFLTCIACFGLALILVKAKALSFVMLAVAGTLMLVGHSFWTPDNDKYSLGFFKLQAQIGFLLALAALAPIVF